jgi:hypothetical protein
MSYYATGNRPIFSTSVPTAAPSTASVIAFLDSTQLGTAFFDRTGQSMDVRITLIAGCDTNAAWQFERRDSSTLADPALETVWFRSPANQSGQYVFAMRLGRDQFLQARMASTGANANCYIQAEALL